MTMKNSETACVLAFALIFIGSVCDKLNVKGDPTAVENETSSENTIFGPLGINGLLLRGIVDAIIPNITHKPTKKNEEATLFCHQLFYSIDAAMVVKGKVMLFVDKDAVIDGRNEMKTSIPYVFLRGPESIQAAVYSDKTKKAYLFKDDRILVYLASDGYLFLPYYDSKNSNKNSYNPECAIWFLDYDIMYVLKKGYLYEFSQEFMNVVAWGNKLRSPLKDLKCDAAISFNSKLYFIIENSVVEIPKYYEREKYYHGNEFFNQKCNILPHDDEFI